MRQAFCIVLFVFLFTYAASAVDIKETVPEESSSAIKWEYLVVGDASNTNLKPTSYTTMRKEPTGAFGREAFMLEQQLDKLGASGWELVSVFGPPGNPAFYFKRRKAN